MMCRRHLKTTQLGWNAVACASRGWHAGLPLDVECLEWGCPPDLDRPAEESLATPSNPSSSRGAHAMISMVSTSSRTPMSGCGYHESNHTIPGHHGKGPSFEDDSVEVGGVHKMS